MQEIIIDVWYFDFPFHVSDHQCFDSLRCIPFIIPFTVQALPLVPSPLDWLECLHIHCFTRILSCSWSQILLSRQGCQIAYFCQDASVSFQRKPGNGLRDSALEKIRILDLRIVHAGIMLNLLELWNRLTYRSCEKCVLSNTLFFVIYIVRQAL